MPIPGEVHEEWLCRPMAAGLAACTLCAAITLSPSAADRGGFFHAIFVWVCVGESDDSTDRPVALPEPAAGGPTAF